LLAPGSANAHLRSGTVAVDYKASLFAPQTAAYRAQIFQSDRALGLTVKSGHSVALLGYLGEPVFRLDSAGLLVNTASPTAVVLRLVSKSQRVVASAPHWRLEPKKHSVVWADSRAQGLGPGVSEGTFKVPLLVDGRRTELAGLLRRFAKPTLWPWLIVLVGLLAAGVLPRALDRKDVSAKTAVGLGLIAAVGSMVLVLAFAFDAYASPGTWIEAFDAAAFLLVGLWLLRRGPGTLRMAAAIGLGLVGVTVGLLASAVFFHPIALAVLPSGLMRALAAVAIGAGLSAAGLGALELL
jgi:hypothetical protein